MCFSAEADMVAGVLIGAIGIDALRQVRRPAQLPLAVLPMVFAAHQLIEVVVWWGLVDRVPATVGHHAAWLYLLVAFGVLPVLVPFAVGVLEPPEHRGRMAALVGVGTVVAGALIYPVVRGPISARDEGHFIAYEADLWHGDGLVVLYVLATCGSMLLSAQPRVRAYGAINLAAVIILGSLNQAGFVSLWCVWAGITSVVIDLHLRRPPSAPRARVLSPVAKGV